LQKNIIGTWKNNFNYSITYYPDHTFIDSLILRIQLNDTSIIVKKGKYDITNSILTYDEFYIDTLIGQNQYDFFYWESAYEITIDNGILKRKQLDIFKNIGENKMNIWDKWESTSWFAQFNPNNNFETYNGRLIRRFYFIQDSNLCLFTGEIHNVVTDSIYENSSYYYVNYNPPRLSLSNSLFYFVEFKDQKMYWYYDDASGDLYKSN
jgi:hypothetical protein